MVLAMTNPIKNDSMERKRKRQRIVDVHTERDYYLAGKKVNRNVYELQRIYESTQAKSSKVLPEFVERIRFMVLQGIRKATRQRYVDQQGELFNFVLTDLLSKIVPQYDTETKKYTTKYKPDKANLGAYILNSCYWATRSYQGCEDWHESMLSSGEFFENYDKVSEDSGEEDLGELKFITGFDVSNTYVPLIQSMLKEEIDG